VTRLRPLLAPLLAAALLGLAAAGALLCAQPPAASTRATPHVIAAYSTNLDHRSPGQIANALSAAQTLDGAEIAPGAVFSFNQRVGPWTADRGYRRAPVSYDGEITLASGGGVCQLSTTLYAAALLGGMEVLERHRHFWPVNYARPGLDAAVAYPAIDLRFRNPLPAPVRLRARRAGDRLVVELLSLAAPPSHSIAREYRAVTPPATVLRTDPRLAPGQTIRANQGQPGSEVVVYRVRHNEDGTTERSLVSVDSYPTLNRIVKVAP
jgi:vancomycin resistance protein YoaR